MDSENLELPLGRRSFKYRVFEILPGFLSYSVIILLIILSLVAPFWASVYLLVIITSALARVVFMIYHLLAAHRQFRVARSVNWSERLSHLENPDFAIEQLVADTNELGRRDRVHLDNLQRIADQPDKYPLPSRLFNAVIVAAYNEPYEVIRPTFEAIVGGGTHDTSRIILVFAYEERGGDGIKETVRRLESEYSHHFRAFITVMHPKDLPNEVIGKGPNITYAAERLEEWCDEESISRDDVIITTLDCDNKPHRCYFDYLTYEYVVHENRQQLSYQPLALFFTNIWDVPAPMRIIAVGNSFWTMIVSMRPHILHNFASHSQPMSALSDMGYWSKRSIVEDGHQYWRSYFHFNGNYRVMPIYLPIYQDAVYAESLKKTIVAQFKQLRRWAYGVTDIPYVAVRLFSKKRRNVPFFEGLAHLLYIIDGHMTLAVLPPLIAFGAWVPLLISPIAPQEIVVHNLPEVVSILQRLAMIGLFTTIILSMRMLPPRPARYGRQKSITMVLQWILMPITALAYNSLAAFNAQTHLMLGKYLDKFDVTEKATYETTRRSRSKKS